MFSKSRAHFVYLKSNNFSFAYWETEVDLPYSIRGKFNHWIVFDKMKCVSKDQSLMEISLDFIFDRFRTFIHH